jgi:hypothetical protein
MAVEAVNELLKTLNKNILAPGKNNIDPNTKKYVDKF